ncbi:nucleotide pyrophosphohydrolase [Bacillus lacus]|uniref:Nucleotide pyrophosphohydrolase n=1 Tax=Metabacillus lacus TaxID=1983721 RepID=A0A7X2M1B2_9BACI|nr:nucleotide pyrophosphohydrolase [Metabacillus lacus]MRX73984.1 nucleotide pyrophosphohydrolase [Metabacillus lacus]
MNELMKKITDFRDERGWSAYHNEKDLAVSILIEASELLENFQWKTSEEAVSDSFQNIKEEMADVLIYLMQLADRMNIDLEEEACKKLEKNAVKYPIDRGLRGE